MGFFFSEAYKRMYNELLKAHSDALIYASHMSRQGASFKAVIDALVKYVREHFPAHQGAVFNISATAQMAYYANIVSNQDRAREGNSVATRKRKLDDLVKRESVQRNMDKIKERMASKTGEDPDGVNLNRHDILKMVQEQMDVAYPLDAPYSAPVVPQNPDLPLSWNCPPPSQ